MRMSERRHSVSRLLATEARVAAGAEPGESRLSQHSSEAEHEQDAYQLELPAARHGPTEAYHMVFGGGQDAGGSAHGSSIMKG